MNRQKAGKTRGVDKSEFSSPVNGFEDNKEQALFGAELEAALSALRGSEQIAQNIKEERLARPIGYTRKHGGLPPTKKSLGQNWLNDPAVARDIVDALDLQPGIPVLEVGPGSGRVTGILLERGAEVIAVEIDRRMVEVLEGEFAGEKNLTVIHEDIIQADFMTLTGNRPYILAGNLPYNISSALLFKLIEEAMEHPGKMLRFIIMLQLEVAKRISALPGTSEYSILSVFLRLFGVPELLFDVTRDKFDPPPNVDSAVLRMDVAPEVLYPVPHWPTLKHLVKGTFHKRRKMLRNSMGGIPHIGPWQEIDFDWSRRPQTLSAEEFAWIAAQLVPKHQRSKEDSDG